jgi:putative tryptophan/tyrosine transport system substrate-binding protein
LKSRRTLLLATAAWPLLHWSQAAHGQTKGRRIGLLSAHTQASTASWYGAFRSGLRERGWIEGKNLGIEYRYGEGKSERVPEMATELVRLNVEVIIASVTPDAFAAQRATKTIPIVIVAGGDPVEMGLAASLARPGGNITGLTPMTAELGGKRLELLAEAVPKLSRIAVLRNPDNASAPVHWKEIQTPAKRLGVQLVPLEIRNAKELDRAFDEAARERVGALFIIPDPVITPYLKRVADLALKNRLPSIFHVSEFADAGGLLTYGPDRADLYRRAAIYVDKILNGARPADLPIEQPIKFELVANMKTAKALGLPIPQTILVRADRLIE